MAAEQQQQDSELPYMKAWQHGGGSARQLRPVGILLAHVGPLSLMRERYRDNYFFEKIADSQVFEDEKQPSAKRYTIGKCAGTGT